MKPHIAILSESRYRKGNIKRSNDSEGIADLLLKNFSSLTEYDIEFAGSGGKGSFSEKLANYAASKFAEFESHPDKKLYIFAVRDSDTNDEKKIDQLHDDIIAQVKLKRLTHTQLDRLKIHFAVLNIECWIVADQDLHEKPETVSNAKDILNRHFKSYAESDMVTLLPQINVSKVKSKCPHFGKFYDDVHVILNQDQ